MEPRATPLTGAWTAGIFAAILIASSALATDALDPSATISLAAPASSHAAPDAAPSESTAFSFTTNSLQEAKLDSPAQLRYAQEGSHWGTVGMGITTAGGGPRERATGYNPTFSYTYFMIDGVEITGELGGWYYAQYGDNAFAINPCAVLRWHFWRSEDARTTVYFDAGIGLLLSNDNIPEGGTSFNFTPRFGVGLTQQITDSGWRLQAGLRWNHVSNARFKGDINNPSRDGPLLYFGVIFPF